MVVGMGVVMSFMGAGWGASGRGDGIRGRSAGCQGALGPGTDSRGLFQGYLPNRYVTLSCKPKNRTN